MAKKHKLLAQSSFWTLNKIVARKLKSNDATLLLAELCDVHDQHPNKNYVFRKQEDLMESCNLTLYGLRNAVKLLSTEGLLEVKRCGTPPLNRYKVDDEKVYELLTSDFNSFKDTQQEDVDTVAISDENSSNEVPISIAYNNKQDNNKQPSNNHSINKRSITYKEYIDSLSIEDATLLKSLDKKTKEYLIEQDSDLDRIQATKYELIKLK